MSDNSEIEAPYTMSREQRITIPLALLAGIIATTAIGYAKWASTNEQLARNTDDIKALNAEVRMMSDTLAEIRGDVRYLVRNSREDRKP